MQNSFYYSLLLHWVILISMLKDILQIYTVGIVLTGDFNPAIIQPFWLSQKKLIGEQEASGANVKLIHKDLVRFEIDWFYLEVTKSRLELRTSKMPYFEPLKDLIIGIFELLKETPLTAVGINHIMHIPIREEQQYDKLGNNIVALSTFSKFMRDPKVLELQIVEQNRKDGLAGSLTVNIAPSNQTSSKRAIAININDHYNLPNESHGRSGEIINLLSKNWSNSFERAKEISESFWSNFVL